MNGIFAFSKEVKIEGFEITLLCVRLWKSFMTKPVTLEVSSWFISYIVVEWIGKELIAIVESIEKNARSAESM